jgi:hypothetical protein
MGLQELIAAGGHVAMVAICGFIELILLLVLRRRVRQTTLTAAWWWAVAATISFVVVEVVAFLWRQQLGESGATSLRLIAAPLAFCPAMAVLGAKRPQHLAWQFIVLSMWGVLAIPGLEHFVLQRAAAIELHGVRIAFVMALIGLGVLNWVPTRHWEAAICIAVGQALLYVEQFPGLPNLAVGAFVAPGAAVFFVMGTVVLTLDVFAPRRDESGLDRVWLDFRDSYGALWALRVAERVDAAAAMHEWPLSLTWSGFRWNETPPEGADVENIPSAINVVLDNLLRRFVSQEWIAKRREQGVH